MDQQLSDARTRIVQLTAEVQSSKQVAEHHEKRAASLSSQVSLMPLPAQFQITHAAVEGRLLLAVPLLHAVWWSTGVSQLL